MADVGILNQPIRQIETALGEIMSIGELADLGRAEQLGAKRSGVLNAVQARIGQLAMAGEQVPEYADTTKEDLLSVVGSGEGAHAIVGGTIEQRREPNVPLWVKEGPVYMPRLFANGAVQDALRAGALDYCPDCGGRSCGLDGRGRPTGDINGCRVREPIAFARCPICTRKVWDFDTAADAHELAPGEVAIERAGTPERRLKARVDIHMLAFHADEARIQGLAPMPRADQIVAVVPTGAAAAPVVGS